MFRFDPKQSKTRNQKKKLVVINSENDSESEDEIKNDKMKKIEKENNHIYFYAEVNRNNTFELIQHIRKLENENLSLAHKLCCDPIPIYLHINSFGGCVFNAFNAIDIIEACKVPVYTVIEGATASAGTLISVVGEKRFIRPNAHMLIHQLSSGSWGKMQELEDDFQNSKSLMEKIINIYKEHADIPKKQLKEILKHDLWWDSDTCISYGLVDEIWDRV